MKRPISITFFAVLLSLEAFYELILFPFSVSNPTLQPILENLPYSVDLLTKFGLIKGIYALIGAYGLFKAWSPVKYLLWYVTPLFPITSLILTGTIGLAPLSIILTILYVISWRTPEVKAWFEHQQEQQNSSVTLESQPENPFFPIVAKTAKQSDGLSISSKIALFFGGYLFLNTITSISLLKWPLDWSYVGIIFMELTLGFVSTAFAVKFGKVEQWNRIVSKQLVYVGVFALFFSVMLLSVMDSPQYDTLNELMSGQLTSTFVLQNALYSLFVLSIAYGLRTKTSS